MKHLAFIFSISLFWFGSSESADYYKWVDEQGTPHYTDSIEEIPERYQKKREEKRFAPIERSDGSPKSYTVKGAQKPGPVGGNDKGLKQFVIPYKAFSRGARRILIPVTFNNSVKASMILDTGAPGMIISRSLAKRLGLYKRGQGMIETKAAGLGGTVPATMTIIDNVAIGGAKDTFVPTTITDSISKTFDGLIGLDFMASYTFSIDTAKRTLIINELPPGKGRPGGHDQAWWRMTFHNFAQMRGWWKNYLGRIRNEEVNTDLSGELLNDIVETRKNAEKQVAESEILFRKLESYATYNSVPMHWRSY